MAKTIKLPDLSAAVVLDTNPLFSENEIELVSKESLAELGEIQKTPGIEIFIPRVVAGELLFRKDWGLTNLRNDASRKLGSIGRLVAWEQPSIPEQQKLRLRLQRRFVTWCKANKIKLWRVPFGAVNWRRFVSLAINRQPPFSPFDPKGKSEKGFRDALILETLCDIHRSVSKQTVFICDDQLLTGAAKSRLGSGRLQVYKSSTEYLSYLKLQRQNLLDETIKAILEEATALFYTPDSSGCVYTNFDVPAKFHFALPAEFAKTPPPTALLLAPIQSETFTPSTAEGYRIGATNIEASEGKNQLTFKTEVVSAQGFQSSNPYVSEQVRLISATVFWNAMVQFEPEIELSSPKFRSVKWEKTAFEVATDDLLRSFNLPTRLDRILASFKPTTPGG